MYLTEKELRKLRSHLRRITAELTEIEKTLLDGFLAVPEEKQEEEPVLEHVGYDAEQCGRNK